MARHDRQPPARALTTTGKPEVRRSRCRYILDDQEVGLPSDEVVITAQPY